MSRTLAKADEDTRASKPFGSHMKTLDYFADHAKHKPSVTFQIKLQSMTAISLPYKGGFSKQDYTGMVLILLCT